ncbi:PP2C family protein-serine/threonine phosphatase, partial [Planotetraspora kaengkrachanensis]|uniref:PP2C family protein-serine/threonine phosphatase n=1 Tax=Planotetraspora kaengkrachanensis TaxID=575193 RepID=UPI0023B22DDC
PLQVLSALAQAVSAEIALRGALTRANRRVSALQAAGATSTELAQTLQRSLLPPIMPQMAGMQTAAAFIPAAGGVIVTGDFYDLFPLGESRWCVVLGDVSGHGVDAAQITTLARYTIRADALNTLSPTAFGAAQSGAIGPTPTRRTVSDRGLRHPATGPGRFHRPDHHRRAPVGTDTPR